MCQPLYPALPGIIPGLYPVAIGLESDHQLDCARDANAMNAMHGCKTTLKPALLHQSDTILSPIEILWAILII
jgi:hypothetical protein